MTPDPHSWGKHVNHQQALASHRSLFPYSLRKGRIERAASWTNSCTSLISLSVFWYTRIQQRVHTHVLKSGLTYWEGWARLCTGVDGEGMLSSSQPQSLCRCPSTMLIFHENLSETRWKPPLAQLPVQGSPNITILCSFLCSNEITELASSIHQGLAMVVWQILWASESCSR